MVKQCPKCKSNNIEMRDTRPSNGSIRRRRMCLDCKTRWTTYEVTEEDFKFLQQGGKTRTEIRLIAFFREFVNDLNSDEKKQLLEELFS